MNIPDGETVPARRTLGVGLALSAIFIGSASGQASAPAVATSATTDAEKGVTTLGKYFVNDGKLEPFTGPNVDLPRTINDVQPYFLFDAKEIELSGAATIGEFLQLNLPMNTAIDGLSQNVSASGVSSSVNLRGLGDAQTLILINGRRAPAANLVALGGIGSQSNLHAIPMGSVDRIEVLPASAAAIYGGNAVGGVINIVLKRNYTGGHLRSVYQNTFDTDAPIRRVELSYGFALEGGRTQVTLSAAYSDQKALVSQDRSFARQNDFRYVDNGGPTFPYGIPATATPNIVNTATTANLVLKNGGGSIGSAVTFIPYGIGPTTPAATLVAGLRANAGTINRDPPPDSRQYFGGPLLELGPNLRSKSFGVTIRREMNANLEVNLDLGLSGMAHTHNGSPYASQRVAADVPSNPFMTAVNLFLAIPGDWVDRTNTVTRTATIGFVQKLPHGWRVQGDYTWNAISNGFITSSAVLPNSAEITAALTAGRLNPFLDTTLHPFDLVPYRGFLTYSATSGSNNVALRATGPAWRLPGGAPLVRLGLERYQQGDKDSERFQTYENFPARNGDVMYLGKSQITRSAYFEAQIPVIGEANRLPLIRQFDLQIAARTDDYDVRTGTGQVTLLPVPAVAPVIRSNRASYLSTNPTYGLSYKPAGWLQLRASFGRGFTPPRYSLLVLDPTPSTVATTVTDPRRGGASTQIFTIGGGNPDLNPQSSDTTTAGAIIQPEHGPLKGLRLSVDYTFTRTRDVIGTLLTQQFVDLEAKYPDRIVRGAVAPGDPFGVGVIQTVAISPVNLLKASSETFDVRATYRLPTAQRGTFLFSSLATFGNHYRRKLSLTLPEVELANVSGYPLKFAGNASVAWDYRRWNVRWSSRFSSRYRVPGPPLVSLATNVIPQGSEFIPAQVYSDFLVGYRFPERKRGGTRSWRDYVLSGAEVQLGINNVMNKVPPFDVSTNMDYGSRGNARLREFMLSVNQPF